MAKNSLVKREKFVALGRALAGLLIVILLRGGYILPTTAGFDFDLLLMVFFVYILFTLLSPFQGRTASFIFSSIDLILITSLSYYSGGYKSPLNLLYYLSIVQMGLRFSWAGGITLATLVSLFFVFGLSLERIGDLGFWGNKLVIFYALAFFSSSLGEAGEKQALKEKLKRSSEKILILEKGVSQLKRRVREETIRDGVTELHNLKYFLLKIAEEIPQARRHRLTFSLVVLGVDNFRAYNSAYGVKRGDEALRVVGMLLKTYMRNSDLVARYDRSDKFLILFPFTNGEQAVIPVERFREAVSMYRLDERDLSVHLNLSAGIATFPEDGGEEGILLEKAEAALRRAKAQGKDKTCLFGQ